MKIEPVTLRGKFVYLEPLGREHLDGLAEVGLDPALWKFTVNRIGSREDLSEYLEGALKDREAGLALPFVTRLNESDKIVGSTRLGNIDVRNRKAEIGWTWIGTDWQRTRVNTEAKVLMLTHAFETWGCIRVELKTDALNLRSRRAILRLGAKEEGTLRCHMITDSGRFRDSVYFSILADEWPEVKAALTRKLEG